MAFQGYYVKVDGTTFPNDLLDIGGYSNTPNQETDKNSYVDGNGALKRTVLPVKRSGFKIKTIDGLTYGQKLIIQAFFIPKTLKELQYWNDETNKYETADFYIPTVEYVHKTQRNGSPIYQAIELEFIAYGGDK